MAFQLQILLPGILLFFSAITATGQDKRIVELFADVTRFYDKGEPYAEVHFYISGESLVPVPTPDSQWRSSVDVLLFFEKDSVIVQYDHLLLNSPQSISPGQDFVDIRRYKMNPGTYRLHIEAFDIHQPQETLIMERTVVLDPSSSVWSLSDPMLLKAVSPSKSEHPLVRNGYLMEPLPHRFYAGNSSMLYFYQEVYCLEPSLHGRTYQFDYHLEKTTGNSSQRIQQAISKKRRARANDPILIQMEIENLPSGNYALVTTLRDSTLQVIDSRSISFQRSNPSLNSADPAVDTNRDSVQVFLQDVDEAALNYALRATAPRAWDKEIDLLNATIRDNNLDAKRHFLHNFFLREDPMKPRRAYEDYLAIAKVVDEQYRSGFGYGFESDRGFILMKYGKPNDIIDMEDEPQAPPYQIWVYNEFPYTGQRNVKFLFYNPSLAPGNYELLHSTARNELQNPRWEVQLYSKLGGNEIKGSNYQDATEVNDQYFRMARRYFEDN